MHVDSRNPQRYEPTISYEEYGDCDGYPECVKDGNGDYVLLKDYEELKGKLENLERKHAKLQRRHWKIGMPAYNRAQYKQLNKEKNNAHSL
jgi:hypothetical protein